MIDAMNRFAKVLVALGALAILAVIVVWNTRAGQDWLLDRVMQLAMRQPPAISTFDGMQVFLCGTSSPLPVPGRAQACVAVLAGDALYVIDTGAGSAQVATLGQLPLERLEAVFLTHFHSDHIAALPEFNLNSWVAGRPSTLFVFGPPGVQEVVDGLNAAYELDKGYRVAHHGGALLPPDLGTMEARVMEAGTVMERGDLMITSFTVNHDPVRPAVGYRFDYKGRSVVVSGDAIVTPDLVQAASGADLLLQDALSLPIIQTLERATAGSRMEKILRDIQDYHAPTEDLSALVAERGVRQLALYHLVPAPRNALLEKIFTRDLPEGTILTRDGMRFDLPAGSDEIAVNEP